MTSEARGTACAYRVGGTFIDYLERFDGTDDDLAAGVAAQVLRRWRNRDEREWFARCMTKAAVMIGRELDSRIPLLELPRSTKRPA